MDIEQTLRLACMAPEPGADFEEVVMARVSAAAWRSAQTTSRRPRRILLMSALFAITAAAAMFSAWYAGSSTQVAIAPSALTTQAASVVAVAAPVTQPAAPVSTPVATPPPATPAASDAAQQCDTTKAALPAPSVYTVLVQPLQLETDDPVIGSRAQEYYGALVEQLRKIPGLALAGKEAATAAKPADFRISVAITNKRDDKPITDLAAWHVTMGLQTWAGNAFDRGTYISREVRTLDASSRCPAGGPAPLCGPAGTASMDVVNLRLPRFPTPAQVACDRAFQESFAEQRKINPAGDISVARQTLERLAAVTVPTNRVNSWRTLRNSLRPELVQPLATALRESNDDGFRKEVVTLLAVKFAADPAAREALAAVAASSADTLMRRVAERALSGDGPWRDYAVARLRDTSLSTAQRLEAWYWMAEVTSLDQQMLTTTITDLLAELQQGNGVRVLVDLLAGTQKDTGEGYGLAGSQGQLTLRQFGAADHPAAPDLLIACFDTAPNYLTLSVLATRRDDPRVIRKLESIAADQKDERLSRSAGSYLRQPLNTQRGAPAVN